MFYINTMLGVVMGEFRKRLKMKMAERGMKQIELARMTGIERSLISSYISGRYEPKDDKLQALAKALDCDAIWLAGYDGIEEDDDVAFLERFRRLCIDDKRTILTLLQFLNDRERRNDEGM